MKTAKLYRDNTMSMNEKHFDALGFVKKSKELGVPEELAEYQARQLENVVDIASHSTRKEFDTRDPATKMDLLTTKTELQTEMKALGTELRAEMKELGNEIKHLDVKVERYRYDSLKFTVWTGVSVVVFLSGLMISLLAKGFHWFS